MARSSRPDDDNLLSGVLLRSRVLEGVNDLTLELFLRAAMDQSRAGEREEILGKRPVWEFWEYSTIQLQAPGQRRRGLGGEHVEFRFHQEVFGSS